MCSATSKSAWTTAINFTTTSPVCNAPTAVVSSNITTTTAKIDWTAPSPAPLSYDVYYSTSNVAPIATTTPSATGIAVTTYNMTALTAATQYYVWVRSVCSATSKSAWTTAINFTTLALCDTPTAVIVSNVTLTSAQLSWTPPATAPLSYDVYVSTSNTAPIGTTTPTLTGITGTTAPLTALTPGTPYYVWVRSVCAAGVTSAWTTRISFTTLTSTGCGNVFNFSENFDGVTIPAFPTCWAKVGTDGLARTQTTNPNSLPNTLYIYGTSATSQAVVSMPPVGNAGSNTHQIKFSARGNFTAGATIQVGYLTNPTDSSTFISIQDIVASTLTYQQFTVIPTGVTGSSVVFAFRHTGSPAFSVLIDDVSWEPIPSCIEPNTLIHSNITTTSAQLDWTAPAATSPSSYDVYSSTSNTVPTGTTTPTASGILLTTYNFTGLSSATKYFVWVRSNCGTGGKSVWSVADSFYTLCAATNVPYTQDFETATIPDMPPCTAAENLSTGTGNIWKTSTAPGSGFTSYTLQYTYNTASPADTWFYTQGLNLTAGTTYRIKFKYGNNSTTYIESMNVSFGTTPTAADMTNAIVDYPSITGGVSANSSTDFTPSTTGVYYIGFHAYSVADQFYLFVDDINVDVSPTCSEPTALVVSNISTTTAQLDWTPPASSSPSSYDVYYSTSNTAPIATSTPNATGITGTVYNMTGLAASTQYFVWVRSDCGIGAGKSPWSVADSFYTLCTATNVPYTQDFETATVPGLPQCTLAENVSTGTGNIWLTSALPGSGFTSNTLQYSYNTASPADTWFYTQGLNLTAGTTYRIKFKYGNNSTIYIESMNVSFGTSPTAADMTNAIVDYPSITGGAYANSSTDFTPSTTGVYYIGFHAYSVADQFYLFVDDINVAVAPACSEPTDLIVSAISTTTAQLDWTAPATSSPSGYDVYYSTSNVAPTATSTPNATGITITTYNMTGLSASTQYFVWVRSDCGIGAGKSPWSVADSFYTLCAATNIPYAQNFETASVPGLPPCTAAENLSAGNIWVTSSAPGSGFTSNTLQYSYNLTSPADTWFYTQGLNLTAGTTYRIKFAYGNNSTSYTESMNVSYGISPTAADMTNAIVDYPVIIGATPSNSSTDFTPSTTGVYYIGFHAYSIANQFFLYVDDINVDVAPACSEPTDLIVSNISTTTAQLDWTPPASSSPTSYDVYYSTSNVAPIANSTPNGTGIAITTYNMTGLSASTQYFVWVRSDCGTGAGKSPWSVADSFYTLCTATNIPYTQNFETASVPGLPPCTAAENLSAGNIWVTSSAPGSGFTSNTLQYSYNLTSPADTWFYTQGLNLTAGTTYRIKFAYGNNSTSYTESMNVSYGISPTAADMTNAIVDYPVIIGATPSNSSTDFTPSTTGVYYIGFHAYSIANQFFLFVDNINVDVAPTCSEPTNLNLSAISTSTAQLDWTAPGSSSPSSYDVYYSTSNTAPTSTSTPNATGITSTVYNMTGLSASTQYFVWVRSDCGTGAGKSLWSVADSFYTLCNTTNVPYIQNFETANVPGMPPCTAAENLSTGTGNIWKTANSPYAAIGFDSKTLQYNYNTASPADTWFYTQGVNLIGGVSYRLKFFYGNNSTSLYTESMNVSYGTSPAAADMTNPIVDYPIITGAKKDTSITDFVPTISGVYYFGFHAYSIADQFNLYVDDILVDTTPSLPIRLVNFKGERHGAQNLLSWVTAFEQNNKSYEMQRSSNGESFTTIGYVNSKAPNGNSNTVLSYEYVDEKPFAGNNFYRLKQVDFDGKSTFSNIVLIKGSKVNSIVLSSVYPNPAKNLLNLVITSPAIEKVGIVVTEVSGRLVMTTKQNQLVSGDNNLTINVGTLLPGTYLIKVVCSNNCETTVSKFIKE